MYIYIYDKYCCILQISIVLLKVKCAQSFCHSVCKRFYDTLPYSESLLYYNFLRCEEAQCQEACRVTRIHSCIFINYYKFLPNIFDRNDSFWEDSSDVDVDADRGTFKSLAFDDEEGVDVSL